MPSTSAILTSFAGIVALLSLFVYFYGIPPELKRKMEQGALKTMGENKMSYMMKDQISKVPDADQQDIKNLKSSLGNIAGGSAQNPLGDTAGEAADDISKPFTGR
ncbi:hypothetical protein EJ05DRAFT_223101 [Pseudovirgaria hyperparasitica]|uniref:Uncharacterized protein n=1 Tax=Pseudovirgaria hyperparasitica TaxID=470096 RepID=A0A6A6VTT6_9PEZI|nr:uncharacterized protein EJ05DRAFT_223101 [Pseudovirgaria hyperparasitica]KAF2753206.1 hypothetical protein EJ05DRAFT_223101 [Pseudovirgaria hyperparasitica]